MPKLTDFTNAFGTIVAILGTISAALAGLGCVPGAGDFTATCQITWLPPSWSIYVGGVFSVVLLLQKWARPGGFLHSMFGKTAVVSDVDAKGTVTPAQVASGK